MEFKNVAKEIKNNGGNWEDIIYLESGEINEDLYEDALTYLNLSEETNEVLIDKKIEEFFLSI